jgi:hypothetical protein
LLGGQRPQFVAGASDTIQLSGVVQVDSDEVDDERFIAACGCEVNGVQLIRAKAH